MHDPSDKLCNHVAYTVHNHDPSLLSIQKILFSWFCSRFPNQATVENQQCHTKECVQHWKHEEHEDCLSKSSLT